MSSVYEKLAERIYKAFGIDALIHPWEDLLYTEKAKLIEEARRKVINGSYVPSNNYVS